MGVLKSVAKEILYRSLLRALKRVLLFFSPFLVPVALATVTILAVFGVAPVEGQDLARAMVKNHVESMKSENRCKYGQEEEFRLPWGVVHAVECYAGEWQAEPDRARVARVSDALEPDFGYIRYTEVIITEYIDYDENGSVVSRREERDEAEVELLDRAVTYQGLYSFIYEEVTDTDRRIFRDDEGRITREVVRRHTYLKPAGRTFVQDYSALDAVIAEEIGGLRTAGYGHDGFEERGMDWPVPSGGTLTSPFGMRYHPVTGEYRMHTGIDIAADEGKDVAAVADGTVRIAGKYGGYGYAVVLEHEGGYSTLYGHNSRITVRQGEGVRRGRKIAEIGSTGVSTGPHLHFEVRRNGSFVDPLAAVNIPEGIVVYAADNPDRTVILETARAFMEGESNLEWLTR
ncbi:MAG: Peptidase M23B [Firmicutes bacterium]|nr:Peptidase M23B [Bacillota bacterium]